MSPHTKVALVTGAGTGIGKAVALAFLQEGLSRDAYRTTQGAAGAGGARGRRRGRAGLIVPTDVRDPASVRALFYADQGGVWSRLDVLFNNAGVSAPGIALEDLS